MCIFNIEGVLYFLSRMLLRNEYGIEVLESRFDKFVCRYFGEIVMFY